MNTRLSYFFLFFCISLSGYIILQELLQHPSGEPSYSAAENFRDMNQPIQTSKKKNHPLLEQLPKQKGPQKNQETQKTIQNVSPSSPSKKNRSKPAFSLPMKHVPFELINGFAVAYGDVLLGKPTEPQQRKFGFATVTPSSFWPSGEVPYYLPHNFPDKERVNQAIAEITQQTNLQFVPFQNGDPDAIVFKEHDDAKFCASYLGRLGGHQPIFLGSECDSQSVLHELMHALGFIHEQSRGDRDNFLNIVWANITEDRKSQFAMVPQALTEAYRGAAFDFDYQSIMMYSENAFAKTNDLKTMESKTDKPIDPVQRGLSPKDIERLNEVYR